MAEGLVSWFDDDKGYGFIKTEDGEEIFVHHSSIEMEGFRTLTAGDPVAFDIVVGSRGPEAKNVRRK